MLLSTKMNFGGEKQSANNPSFVSWSVIMRITPPCFRAHLRLGLMLFSEMAKMEKQNSMMKAKKSCRQEVLQPLHHLFLLWLGIAQGVELVHQKGDELAHEFTCNCRHGNLHAQDDELTARAER